MKNRLLASESFQAGEKTYYLDFNRAENASRYIRISRVDRDTLGVSRRSQVVVFEEDFSFLVSAFASLFQSAAYLGQKDVHVNRPEEMLPEGQIGGIKSWAADARPREKLFDSGAE
ncbi:MAG: hypothetical protein INR69_23235, partial [Mucilaginibacter polytrichastri]|nr:hypothetical protein [Mucilaginibacter polytrichastri]